MSIFKCKICGGTIEFNPGDTVGICDHCGTRQTLPRFDDDRRANLYDRANHFRRNNEFDKAAGLYNQILNEDPTDSEAYWSIVLCRYGIEYIEDPATHKRVPTVNRTQFTSIFDDEDYKAALLHADKYQRTIYEKEAVSINEIQKGILAISQKEKPFDVFISYKETDASGHRTQDSVLANDLYHQLTNEGFKVFFSRITLEDKLGIAYEPYIFAALNSAKVMVVLGTKPENFKAVWVKNEWSRYLSLVNQSGGKKILIPAYRDMDPYDLPEEFSHLQAQDMSKLGFMQDLLRGIKKIVRSDEPKVTEKDTVFAGRLANVSPLLKRAFLFLEDGEWSRADDYCEQVLNQEPENAQAYLGKLMAELQVKRPEELSNCDQPFNNSNNYQKAMRFGSEEITGMLSGYINHINDRNENMRLTGIYNNAVTSMKSATTESSYKAVSEIFKTISGFKDADTLARQCLDKAEACRKDSVYSSAMSQMTKNAVCGYETAIKMFNSISGWRDADEQVYACNRRIEEIEAKKEAERLEREIQAEKKRISVKKALKKLKLAIAITAPLVVICLSIFITLTVIIPKQKMKKAMNLLEDGDYESAYAILEEIGKIDVITSSKYDRAMALIDSGDYETAYALLEEIGKTQKITSSKYDRAMTLINSGDYESAYALLEEIGKNDVIASSKYDRAMALIDSGDYESAYALLEEIGKNDVIASSKYDRAMALIDSNNFEAAYILLDGLQYKDSESKLLSIKPEYQKIQLSKAEVGSYVYFGSYEQDNNTSNGNEDIEWLVLTKEDNRILVISRYALDCQLYDISHTDVTWETCYLRRWLNGIFLNAAFSESEQSMIPSVTISAEEDTSSTSDRIFLLSIEEVFMYFGSNDARLCQGTAYCYERGSRESESGYCWWWLRWTGESSNYTPYVNYDGSIYFDGALVYCVDSAVRPALWINLES